MGRYRAPHGSISRPRFINLAPAVSHRSPRSGAPASSRADATASRAVALGRWSFSQTRFRSFEMTLSAGMISPRSASAKDSRRSSSMSRRSPGSAPYPKYRPEATPLNHVLSRHRRWKGTVEDSLRGALDQRSLSFARIAEAPPLRGQRRPDRPLNGRPYEALRRPRPARLR